MLGQGAFCTVYQAKDKRTKEVIALKVIKRKLMKGNQIDLLRKEAELLQSINHENIVKFKHIREIKGKIFLGMELMKDGTLTDLIQKKKLA